MRLAWRFFFLLTLLVFALSFSTMVSAQALGTVSGHVYAPNGTTPVANARIDLYAGAITWASAFTAGDGSYSINVPANMYQAGVTPEGYPSEYYGNVSSAALYLSPYILVTAGATTANIDFVLDAPASLSGTVYAPNGTTPVANAQINIYASQYAGSPSASMRTNLSGQYTFYVRPGTYRIGVNSNSFPGEFYNNQDTVGSATAVDVLDGQHLTGLNFTLDQGGFVSGKVYAPDGVTPVAGARVWVEGTQSSLTGFTFTDASGSYTLPARVGPAWVTASHPAYWSVNANPQPTVALGATTTANLTLYSPPFSVSGMMHTPAPLSPLPASAYLESLTAALNDGMVTVDPAAQADLAGMMATAEPIYGFVLLYEYRMYGFPPYALVKVVGIRADGTYHIPIFMGGTYTLGVISAGYGAKYWQNANSLDSATHFYASGNLTSYDFWLQPAGTISGRVTDGGGTALAGRIVELLPTAYGYETKLVCTNANGDYLFANVPFNTPYLVRSWGTGGTQTCSGAAGDFYAQYWNNRAARSLADPITLTAGAPNAANINFTMLPGGSISGQVTNDGGSPVSVQLDAYDADGNWLSNTMSDGATGAYTFSKLPPGALKVCIANSSSYAFVCYNQQTNIAAANAVLVTAGATTPNINFVVYPAGTISGTVISTNTTGFLANAIVTLTNLTSGQVYTVSTNTLGGFSKSVAVGDYRVSAAMPGYVTEWYDNVTSPDAAAAIPVAAGATVSGINFTLTYSVPTPLSPFGIQPQQGITYTWNGVLNAGWYYLWISGPGGKVLDQWYSAADYCINGVCSVTPTVIYGAGDHTWWVQAWGDSFRYSAWSAGQMFTFTGSLDAPTPVAPIGVTEDLSPVFQWTEIPGATWYHVWLTEPDGSGAEYWFQDSDSLCQPGFCIFLPLEFGGGIHTWWVQAWGSGVYSAWSAPSFFMQPMTLPTPTAPTGTITTPTPSFSWTPVAGAYWYYLWVSNNDTGYVLDQWYNAFDVCGLASCDVTPPLTLSNGSYTYWLQAWSPVAGYGAWNSGTGFTVAAPLPESPPPIDEAGSDDPA